MTEDTDSRLSLHEQICAERYSGIMGRIGRLETIIIAAAGALIVGMGGLIVTLALKGH